MRLAAALSGLHITGELKRLPGADCRYLTASLSPAKGCRQSVLRGAVVSVKGPRPNNEDSAAVAVKADAGATYVLIAVADGVGGKERGEVASAAAICYALYHFYAHDSYDEGWLIDLFNNAHEAVKRTSQGGATTLTVGVADLTRGVVMVGNVGDSPLYMINPAYKSIADLTPNRDEYEKYITQAVGDRSYRGPHILKTSIPGIRRMILLGVTDGVDDYINRAAYLAAAHASTPMVYACALMKEVKGKTRDNATAAAVYLWP